MLQISDNCIRYAGGIKNIQKQFNIEYNIHTQEQINIPDK